MYGKLVVYSGVVRHSVRYYKNNSSKRLLDVLADMPKGNSGRIADAQRQRQHISKKSEKYGPSTVYLQVLGSGARGVPNTLYLFTDQKRYLFNCGECTQRLAHEHKVKLSRLEHIFITSKTWKNIGGLPGLSLTLQDVGVPKITLHGPDGLDELYNATRRFVIMKDMDVHMAKCSSSEDFDDNVMSVKYVILGSRESLLEKDLKPAAKKPKLDDTMVDKEFEEFIHDETEYYRPELRHAQAIKKNPKFQQKPADKISPKKKSASEKVLHELQKISHCTVAYICTLKKRLGTLDLEKCVEFGVKPGPMLGQLKCGQDVVLPDGTIVLSKDVKTPDDPGPVFIVLDVPDISYLKEHEFDAHFDNGTNPSENIPALVVHFTPPHVFNHATYRAFMSKFGESTRHLVLNSQNSCLGSEAVHRTQHKLHLLDPDIFPLLRDVSVPAVWAATPPAPPAPSAPPAPPAPHTDSPVRLKGLEELKTKIAVAQFQNIINMEGSGGDALDALDEPDTERLVAGRTLTMFHLRPKRQLDRTAEPKLHVQDYLKETMDVGGFVSSLEQFRKLVEGIRYAKSGAQEYPKVVFLGTGSCIPSKTRNTSAIVLQIDENRSMLLDCGEGTFGQLVRFYGPKRVNAFLRTLKAIYVSHLHADHHIGLIGVLQARREALNEVDQKEKSGTHDTLYLLAPGQIVTWLSIYDHQFERIRNEFTLIPNQNLLYNKQEGNSEMTSAVLASIGVQQVRTCLVSHCPNAFGVSVHVNDSIKITYSGDTIPCYELVKLGENSTLLIHEATMEDELADEARTKMHSTTSQAIEIGSRMNARFTVLTHFSQRYARLPRLNAHILHDNNSVGIAFDNMQITMSDLELLPHMYAPLQLMFAEHCVELELKAEHRQRKKGLPSPTRDEHNAGIEEKLIRKVSPTRRVECAAPVPHNTYRESHASTRESLRTYNKDIYTKTRDQNADALPPLRSKGLRQESKGMVVSGVVVPLERAMRSKSRSPTKQIRCNSPNNTPPEDSNMNRDNQDPSKMPEYSPGSEINKPATVHKSNVPTLKKVNARENPRVTAVEKPFPRHRSRSPSPLQAENEQQLDTFNLHTQDPNISKLLSNRIVTSILIHLILWRVHRIASRLSLVQWQFLVTIIAVGVLFWTATKKERVRSPEATSLNARSAPFNNVVGKDTRNTKSYNRTKTEYPRKELSKEIKTWNLDSRPSLKEINTDRHIRTTLVKDVIPNFEGTRKEKNSVPSPITLNDKLRRQCFKEHKPGNYCARPNSPMLSKSSFKPQLEDIKSSYLLLNKNAIDRNVRSNMNVEQIPKPPPLNENIRRKQLLKIKENYKSKKFWNDSKYDKIEGLNWISWK